MIETELRKKIDKLKTDSDKLLHTIYNIYEYSTYPEYKKSLGLFYSSEDIKELRKLYIINKFYKIWSFTGFKEIVKKISIVKLQSPFTTIQELIEDYDIIYYEKIKSK